MSQPRSNILAIFDFDRTLILDDSFRLFSLHMSRSRWQRGLALLLAVQCKLRLIDNGRYKEKILRQVWSTRPTQQQHSMLKEFLTHLRSLENVSVTKYLHRHLSDNDIVAVISASPDFYVKPFIAGLSELIEVRASDVNQNGANVSVNNLYGQAKTLSAQALIDQHMPEYIKVYTDHDSDLPLLELADEAFLVQPSKHLIRSVRKLRIPFEVINT